MTHLGAIIGLVMVALLLLGVYTTVQLIQQPTQTNTQAAGKGGNVLVAATLTVTPNPATPSSTVRVTGTGYKNTTWAEIRQVNSGGQTVAAYTVVVWADGHIDQNFTTASSTGTFTMEAYQTLKKGKRANPTLMAQTTLVVQ